MQIRLPYYLTPLSDRQKAIASLQCAERIASNENGYHYFYGKFDYSSLLDLTWFYDLINTYYKQDVAGLSCLLSDKLSRMREVRKQLRLIIIKQNPYSFLK